MANTYTVQGVLLTGTHAARPAANAVAKGTIYAETDTTKIFQSDGSSWGTWLDASPSAAGAVPLSTVTTAGDLIYATGSAAVTRLASAGVTTKFLQGANAAAPTWAFPPGYEFDYVEVTSAVNITHTTEGTDDTVVTANAVSYDGSTTIMVEAFMPLVKPDTGAAGRALTIDLFDGSTPLGILAQFTTPAASDDRKSQLWRRKLTPSNASHTYSIRAHTTAGTGVIGGGAGGTGAFMPGYIRQTKA